MVGLKASQLGSSRLVSGQVNIIARDRGITADDILVNGPRGGPASPQALRFGEIVASRERILAAQAVAEDAPHILRSTIRREEAKDASGQTLSNAGGRLARVVLDGLRHRFIETALAKPDSDLRSTRLQKLLRECDVADSLLTNHGIPILEEEHRLLLRDAEALEAVQLARQLRADAKACTDEIKEIEHLAAVTARARPNRTEEVPTTEKEIALFEERSRVVGEAMTMLQKWKGHSEVSHHLCKALLFMAEQGGPEFREEMDRRGLGVLASTVADNWADRTGVARCALLLLSTVSIELLLGMIEEQCDHPVLVCVGLEVLNRRAKEDQAALDQIVIHGGREALAVIERQWENNTLIGLHCLNLRRRLKLSAAKSRRTIKDVKLPPQEAVRLRGLWNSLDEEEKGYITSEQLGKALQLLGMKMSSEELAEVMSEVDMDGNNTVSWPEFIFIMSKFGAGQSIEHKFSEEKLAELQTVFDKFDQDGNGSLDVKELHLVMRAIGLSLGQNEIMAMINSVDADGSGCIEWHEFLYLMSKKAVDPENQHKAAFEYFDRKGRGRILRDEFVVQMRALSDEFTVQELEEMMGQSKFEDDDYNSITYKEFVKMMMR